MSRTENKLMILHSTRQFLLASLFFFAACSNSKTEDKAPQPDKPDNTADSAKAAQLDASTAEKPDTHTLSDAKAMDAAESATSIDASAVTTEPPEVIDEKPVAEGLTNIKALPKKWSDKQVKRYMVGISKGLGVKCSHCHVKGDFASDKIEAKLAARKMITMTRSLDRRFMGGKGVITCKTCHHGKLSF
ncbi:MAG: c-type cytochrome [Kofleriaceae bacterium]|nr:c-type cytochrome [Kofleriaceae bacterium]